MAKKVKNYVNNADLLKAIIEYQENCKLAESLKKELPKIPIYIMQCIMDIANKYSNRPNFRGYSYKEEMVADGIESALASVLKFNVERSSNPFAFFTTSIYWAFLRRIELERDEHYIKLKSLENFVVQSHIDGNSVSSRESGSELFTDAAKAFITKYEEDMKKKNAKVVKKDKVNKLDV